MEKIVYAALKFYAAPSSPQSCPIILTAAHHTEIRNLLKEHHFSVEPGFKVGYLTSSDRFVDCREAVPIAINARQIPDTFNETFLLDSDLDLAPLE